MNHVQSGRVLSHWNQPIPVLQDPLSLPQVGSQNPENLEMIQSYALLHLSSVVCLADTVTNNLCNGEL